MAHWRRKRGGSFLNISCSRSAAKAPLNLAANISADVAFCYDSSLDQLKTSAAMEATVVIVPITTMALVRRRWYRLPLHGSASESDDPLQEARALGRAWQNTSAMSSSVTFASSAA